MLKRINFLLLPFTMMVSAQTTEVSSPTDSLGSQAYHLPDASVRIYKKPKFFDFITKAPGNFINTNKNLIAKDHAYYVGGAVIGTVLLLPVDQKLIDNSRELAQQWGMSVDNNYSTVAKVFKLPKDVGSALYLMGNGSTLVLLGIGFGTYGLIKNDYRAQATASGLMESLILAGVFSQTLKRITGRESPFIAIENGNSGGDWNPFPSFSAFATQTPHYDAMPSGHLTTFMAGLTVIADNYPEVKWIKPVGYTLATALCFQMMQSQVHWASDYPLALVLGYFIGKTISKSRYTTILKESAGVRYKVEFTASRAMNYNMAGIKVSF
ncbi:phosphatase PAP2 family protein [uncultured Chryseobacterium sp.]|uniref:phosphatase PAP2 family protein n=1 Tax=uncultured Chryseobacterium sp. TaxID=259322 RepID=UPI0025EEF2DD|nr:phosphatase PAP2 family protein [uncultured Chryseobacterium sp.]